MGVPVSQADRDFYSEHGYLVGPTVLDAARIGRLRAAAERIYGGDYDHHGAYVLTGPFNVGDPHAVKTVLNTWWVNDEIMRLVCDPTITAIAAALLGVPAVRIWQDQFVWKPPAPDSVSAEKGLVGYHQDYGYWHDVSTDNMITANVALQDTDESNGALRVLDGSHALGLVDHDEADFFQADPDRVDVKTSGRAADYRTAVLRPRAGQVTFHHSLTLHASGPNTSAEPRLAIAIGYMPDGAFYRANPDKHHTNCRYLGPRPYDGQPFLGPAFPLVYPVPDEVLTTAG